MGPSGLDPFQYHAKGVGLATATNWVSSEIFLVGSEKLQHYTNRRLLILLCVIDKLFEKGVAAWKTSKFEDKFANRVSELEGKGGGQKGSWHREGGMPPSVRGYLWLGA